jgi:hypothetical protein
MKILVGCEESQAVTIELRKLGHEAYSCDLLPCSGGYPEYHFQEDIFQVINSQKWDKIITFPPCTHLTLSGAKHFEKKRENGVQLDGLRFFFEMWKISDCTENPMGIINGGKYIKQWFPELHEEMIQYGFTFKPSQIIQPWQFGHKAQKTTCLWLRNLPLLKPTEIVDKGEFYITPSGKRMAAWICDPVDENGKKLGYGTAEIKKLRSKTFPGIAKAIAEQWGNL